MRYRLRDEAAVIRSKNSGPFELTLDILFKTEEFFQRVVDAGIINKSLVAELYRIPESHVLSIITFDRARAIKATIIRPLASGDLGERDVYGAQQHAPLMNLEFEL